MKSINISRKNNQQMRHRRIINKFQKNQNTKPRLVVSKTNSNIYAQVIDDKKQHTLAAFSTINLKKNATVETAKIVGEKIAELAIAKGVSEVCFDRGGNKYHGQVKALADGAREKGMKF